MKIDLLVTGKTGERYLNDGIELYQGRLKSYCNFNWREIPSKKWSRSLTPDQIKKKEGELILKEISSKERVVLLDERGLSLTSVQFASFLQKESLLSSSKLLFVIGGAWGFHSSTYQ
ncbi:MAG: 23S rRNA (pseudouridine(1915)-N(3))-methyltransferase RlmH, partial [Bacteroidales bacterium]